MFGTWQQWFSLVPLVTDQSVSAQLCSLALLPATGHLSLAVSPPPAPLGILTFFSKSAEVARKGVSTVNDDIRPSLFQLLSSFLGRVKISGVWHFFAFSPERPVKKCIRREHVACFSHNIHQLQTSSALRSAMRSCSLLILCRSYGPPE
jgi:hypothetical protein